MPSTQASFTGSIPENYDRYLGPLLFEWTAADMARRLAGLLTGPVRVLEVACGTGISTRHLASVLDEGAEILATDLNEAMIEHAARVNGELSGVTYSQADALDLPFDDNSFDAVICQFVLADGSVRAIKKTIHPQILRWLCSRNDGKLVELP